MDHKIPKNIFAMAFYNVPAKRLLYTHIRNKQNEVLAQKSKIKKLIIISNYFYVFIFS